MKKWSLFFSVFIIAAIFQSCKKDEAPKTFEDAVHVVALPRLDKITNDVLFNTEELIIEGVNLIDKENETKLFLNGTETSYSAISETQIKVKIIDLEGTNKVYTVIKSKVSNELPFYVFKSGWNVLEFTNDVTLRNAQILSDGNDIYAMVDANASPTSFYFQTYKFIPSNSGYTPIRIDAPGGNQSNFIIDENGNGLTTNGFGISFFSDKFENLERTFSGKNGTDPGGPSKLILEGDTVFYSSGMHTFSYSTDRGETLAKGYTEFLSEGSGGSYSYFGGVGDIAKSPTTGEIYALGIYWKDRKNGGSPPRTNLIMKSNDYLSWQVIDTVTANPNENLWGAKFIDTDLILTKYQDNNLLKSTDLAKTWSLVDDRVRRFAVRTRNEWYIYTTENTVESTVDGGQTWIVELELEEDNIVSSINFANNKIIVAGTKNSYLKLE